MVGRVLAKDEVGVRFSLTAPRRFKAAPQQKFKDIHSVDYRNTQK
jgi:hypothetical protein